MPNNIYDRIGRDRAPRVHISYEVDTGGATERRELPFVMGVLGDFTGRPEKVTPLGERKFVEVTPDNVDAVMRGMQPGLSYSVPNRLSEQEGGIGVRLDFTSMEDFSPERVAMRVPQLARLMELRRQLSDLRGSLQGNDRLEEVLQATLSDPGTRERLKRELRPRGGDDARR